MRSCIVIPAYQPENILVSYVRKLLESKVGPVLVVDDGSRADCQPIFDQLAGMEDCIVLHHPVNRGKGAALKTAIHWYRTHPGDYEGCSGIVTADCDGQHAVEDVLRLAAAMEQRPDSLILGCRDFGEDTPRRSAMGNRVTSFAMNLLYDIRLKDTQTGLRGLPNALLEGAEKLRGNRYEYELNMLLWAKQHAAPFVVIPIQTIYFNNNAGTHYRAVADSMRILGQLLRGLVQYGVGSLISALADVLIYALLVKWVLAPAPLTQRLFLSAVIARVLSSVVNYFFNRSLPFMRNKSLVTIVKYYVLWLFQLAASFGFVWLSCTWLQFDELIAKLLVDILLALFSYQIQLRWVFRIPKENTGLRSEQRGGAEENAQDAGI